MYIYRNRKFILHSLALLLAFALGCLITSSLINVEKQCVQNNEITPTTKQLTGNSAIFLIILILSAPKNIEQRNLIRRTWLNLKPTDASNIFDASSLQYNEFGFLQQDSIHAQTIALENYKQALQQRITQSDGKKLKLNVLHYFSIGTNGLSQSDRNILATENETFKDLLLFDNLKDTYRNLTQKLLLSFESINNIPSFKYLLKTDDDTYVKVDHLLEDLHAYDQAIQRYYGGSAQTQPELYWGYFNGRARIKRRGSWKEMNFNLCERYLPYALGGAYVISKQLVNFIATNRRILSPFSSEDVSVGVWLASLRNVYRRHDVRFDTSYLPRKCRNYHIALHKRTIDDMKNLYLGYLCTFKDANGTSVSRPAEYFYDWSQTPEQCCSNLVPE